MKGQHGKSFEGKGLRLGVRFAAAAVLSAAIVVFAAGGARAQVVAADPVLCCCPFQKEAGFARVVIIDGFGGAQSATQSYYDLVQRYDPRDPDPDKPPIFLAEIDYRLDASVDEGSGRVYNSISSLPFRPGGPRFQGNTSMSGDYSGSAGSLVAVEQFSFSGFEGNPQRGSAVWGGMGFYTELIQGNAWSHVQFDTGTRHFVGSYLGNATGVAEIGFDIGAVSGETGVSSSSQSYSGSVRVEGDYLVRYTVSGGPSTGGIFGW